MTSRKVRTNLQQFIDKILKRAKRDVNIFRTTPYWNKSITEHELTIYPECMLLYENVDNEIDKPFFEIVLPISNKGLIDGLVTIRDNMGSAYDLEYKDGNFIREL